MSMSVSASTNKCGWTECQPADPPIIRYFLKDTYSDSINAIWDDYNGSVGGVDYFSLNYQIQTKNVQTRGTNCSVINDWSGTVSYTRVFISSTTTGGGSITNPLTGEWDDGGTAALDFLDEGDGGPWPDIIPTTTDICTSTTFGYNSVESYSDGPTYGLGGSLSGGNLYYIEKSLDGLSMEYTDTMLRNAMIGMLPPYPTDWGEGGGSAFYKLVPDHSSCSGGKMKYKFFLCGGDSSQKGQQFRLDWDETTTFPDNQPPTVTKQSEVVTGTGDPDGMYSSVHEVQVPAVPSSISESIATVTPIPNGGGGGGGGGGGHGGQGPSSPGAGSSGSF